MIQYTSRQSWQIPCHIPGPVMISSIFCFNHHLVGGFNPTPLKNDGLRHLGWWHSQLNVIITRGYFQKKEYHHELLGEFPIKITMNQHEIPMFQTAALTSPWHHRVGLVQRQLVQGTQEPGPIHPVLDRSKMVPRWTLQKLGFSLGKYGKMEVYPPVNQHSYGKIAFIVDLPTQHGGFLGI